MNEGLKQRIVGAVVLVCLGLILWPILFSESIGPAMDKESKIPPVPAFEKYQIAPAKQPENLKPIAQYQPMPEEKVNQVATSPKASVSESKITESSKKSQPPKQATKTVEKPASKTLHSEKGLPIYWALQVGSFRDASKAKRLKSELIKQGYKVDTRKVKTAGGDSIRVYVGPKLDKALLKKDQAKIDSAFKVKSMLVRFSQ